MAATITVSCPKCKKTLKVPTKLKGKKIRCKGCGQTFPVVEMKTETEEWGVAQAYGVQGVTEEEPEEARCPFCAHALEDENTVVCMNCGYNLRTRERIQTKVYEPVTGRDYLVWLMPGILCCLGALACIGGIVWVWVSEWDFGEPWTIATKVYLTVMFGFGVWYFGVFAFKRLVLHPKPPEQEKVTVEREEDD